MDAPPSIYPGLAGYIVASGPPDFAPGLFRQRPYPPGCARRFWGGLFSRAVRFISAEAPMIRPYPFLDFFCFFSLRFSFNDFSDFFFTSFWVSRALDMVISFGWLSSIGPSVPNIFYNTSFSHLLHRNIISGVISVKVALYPLERAQTTIGENRR